MAEKQIEEPTGIKVNRNEEAQHAAADEKQMSLMQAIKLYPKAVGWSVVLSSALIMEGYDLALLGSLYGSPQFNSTYFSRFHKTKCISSKHIMALPKLQ